jgi:glucuronoarabinoxylan endo-1,4-beta-xylanase
MWMSYGNEAEELCQKMDLTIGESLDEDDALVIDKEENQLTVVLPSQSLCTYIFKLDSGNAAIKDLEQADYTGPKTYYDLQGRRLDKPQGLCIERHADGTSRKVIIED